MSVARKVGLNLAMWLLGMAAFAAFAWLVQWLDGSPVRVPAAAEVPEAVDGDPLAALVAGSARTLGTAAYELDRGERSRAAHAVDAALRATEVGHEASHGEVKEAFVIALRRVVLARGSLHRGAPEVAADHLRAAADELAGVIDAARGTSPGVPPPLVRDAYHGAVLLNANGSMIGQVARIDDGTGGPTAVVRLGGANDVLGIMDLGGRTQQVPADRLLWGPRRSIGSIFVVLPAESSEPAEIVDAST